MNVQDFRLLARLLKERSGLVLSQDKAYLLESRLNPVSRRHSFKSIDELVAAVRRGKDEKLLIDVTEAMTINESFFFRDSKPFEQFRLIVLPHLLERRARTKSIRIWSAACSSGQEPYSLAMILKENAAKLVGWKIDILATDLSEEVLQKAKDGIYSQFEVQCGLPINLLVKYFNQENERWRISDEIRQMVTYETFNFLDSPKMLGSFDVVFCRNVLIYFDQVMKSRVLNKVAELMPDDGFLYLGGAETVLGICDRFQLIPGQRGIYGLGKHQSKSTIRAAS